MLFKMGTSESGHPVTIDTDNYQNTHMSVDGASGSGKSTFLRKMLEQVPAQSGHALAFDVSGDLRTTPPGPPNGTDASAIMPDTSLRWINIRSPEVSINPLLPRQLPSGYWETPSDVGFRMAEMLRIAYGIGDVQAINLANAISDFVESCVMPCSIGGLLSYLNCQDNETRRSLAASISRLTHLTSLTFCGLYQVSPEVDCPGLTVLDFCDLPVDGTQALLTELLVTDILDSRMLTGAAPRFPLVLVFDEAQRFRLTESSALVRLLREGRRFGVSGWFATQYLKKKADADALANSALHIQFRPVDTQVRAIARTMARGNRMLERRLLEELPRLRPGQFFFRDEHGNLRKVIG